MTRSPQASRLGDRRKTLLVILALLLPAGGLAWYWQATAVDRQVRALLNEVRIEDPDLAKRWLIKLRLMKDRRTGRNRWQMAGDLTKLGPAAVPELIRALRDSDTEVLCCAVDALGWLGDTRAVEPLIAPLKDKDQLVRISVAEVLGKLGDLRAVEPLIAALKDESAVVRCRAARALAKLGDGRGVGPLEKLLGDQNVHVRMAATEALEKLRRQSEGKPFGGAQDKP